MKGRAAIFVLACAALAFAQRPPVEEAWDLLAKGDRAGAVKVLERIVASNPRDGDARLMLGAIFTEDGRLPDALAQLEQAVRLKPQSADARQACGEALVKSGNPKAARAEFEKAVALKPDFAQARVDLAAILLESGESPAAAAHLDRALALLGREPESAFPKYLRARIWTAAGDAARARALLENAVAVRPEFAEAWSDLGLARKTLLDDPGAFDAFRRSVELDPENAIAQYRLGAEYLRQGKAHEAIAHLEKARALKPRDQSTLYSLQLALRQAGQAERARQVKEELAAVLKAIDTESQNAFAALRLNNEGAALEKAGNLRAALEKYRAGVELDPTHNGIRVNFAAALLRLGQWREGLDELREAVRREPANALYRKALEDAIAQAPPESGGKGKAGTVGKR